MIIDFYSNCSFILYQSNGNEESDNNSNESTCLITVTELNEIKLANIFHNVIVEGERSKTGEDRAVKAKVPNREKQLKLQTTKWSNIVS